MLSLASGWATRSQFSIPRWFGCKFWSFCWWSQEGSDERVTTFESCHGVETGQEQGKLFSLVWHLVLFLLHVERNVCGHACFSVQWTNFIGRLCQFVGRDVDTRIQIVSPCMFCIFHLGTTLKVIVMNTICGLAFGQLWPQLFLSCTKKQLPSPSTVTLAPHHWPLWWDRVMTWLQVLQTWSGWLEEGFALASVSSRLLISLYVDPPVVVVLPQRASKSGERLWWGAAECCWRLVCSTVLFVPLCKF